MKARKHFVLLTLALVAHFEIKAQTVQWLSHYGNNALEIGLLLAADEHGQLYGTGTVGAPSLNMDGHVVTVSGDADILIVKWDSTGHAIWTRNVGASGFSTDLDQGKIISYDPVAEHLIVSGQYAGESHFGPYILYHSPTDQSDMFVAAYDTAGNCLWAHGGRDGFLPQELLVDSNSNVFAFVYVLGTSTFQSTPPVTVPPGGCIARYSASGTLLSAKTVLTNGGISGADWADEGNGWFLAGVAYPGATLYDSLLTVQSPVSDGFVAHTDTAGAIQWITTLRSDSMVAVYDCVRTSSGHVIVAGYFSPNVIIGMDTLHGASGRLSYFIASLNSSGTLEWATPISSPTYVGLTFDIAIGPDDGIYALGYFQNELAIGSTSISAASTKHGFVARFDTTGACTAAWHFGHAAFPTGSVLPTDHGVFVSSVYDSTMVFANMEVPAYQEGTPNFFVAKLDAIEGYTGTHSMVPLDSQLHIYANPNNGLCTIELPQGLRQTSGLVLSVFDDAGQLVQRTPLRFTAEGIRLDVRAQAKGIYHVELGDGEQRYSGSIVFE